MIKNVVAVVIASMLLGAPAVAQPSSNPIPHFGKITPLPDAGMQPDPSLDYRVAFSITKAAAKPDQVNASLEKVARYVNLLAAGGVYPRKGKVLVVVHGPATDLILKDEAFRRKHGARNPNIPLMAALEKAGVDVHVCGQALAAQKITKGDVYSGVVIDLSALVTLTTLELKGWAVLAD